MVFLSLQKTGGVVIKVREYKENDKLVWIYTEKLGKITAIAKGAKKSKSSMLALTLPLCFAEYVFFKGKNLYNIQEGKMINSFQGLLSNLDKLTYSSYICELIDICVDDNDINDTLYREFITCLYLLNTDALDYEMLIRSFELKLLKSTGYNLNFDNCVKCKSKITVSNYISLSHFGGVCDNCNREYGIYISKASYNALRFLNNTPMDKIYKLKINEEVKKDIGRVTTYLISNNYSKRPKSLDMLNYIKE